MWACIAGELALGKTGAKTTSNRCSQEIKIRN